LRGEREPQVDGKTLLSPVPKHLILLLPLNCLERLGEFVSILVKVRAARFDHSITDYFIPLHTGNDEQNVANLLLAPEAWPTIYRFFSSLEISLE
jgi:hypothetical protein